MHVIVDNYATHKHPRIKRSFAARPRFHVKFAPTYASWLNQVEIWFHSRLYDFERGASVHEHFHPQEEVYEVTEGELEVTIDGVVQIARPGLVAIVPARVRHSIKARSEGRPIIVDYPLRLLLSGRDSDYLDLA